MAVLAQLILLSVIRAPDGRYWMTGSGTAEAGSETSKDAIAGAPVGDNQNSPT
jgi:hypothetical protein